LALLLHGTGAASHSWRHLAPLMAAGFEVLAPDLPGHGHTRGPANVDLSLPGMAGAIAQWLQVLGVRPQLLVGHSAGAAIAARWWLDHVPDAGTLPLVALNAALRPLGGIGRMFSPVARLLPFNPLVPAVFSWHAAQPMVLRRLLAGTGSVIDAEGERLYAALVADSRHTAGALRMMASWELEPLQPLLPRLGAQLHLIAGGADRTLPASESESVHRQVRGSSLTVLPGLGHLAHEEDAAAVWAAMRAALGADLGAVQGSVQSV
jgi:magnesium chelatase accessory protein